MSTDGIAQVLEEIRLVTAELVEIKADVKLALSHGEDITQLNADIVRIEAHLKRIDSFMEGPPALAERLKRLEVKQEKDRKTAARETTEAVDDQAVVNKGVAAKLLELFGITGDLQGANVRLFGMLVLVGAAVGSILLRILGA